VPIIEDINDEEQIVAYANQEYRNTGRHGTGSVCGELEEQAEIQERPTAYSARVGCEYETGTTHSFSSKKFAEGPIIRCSDGIDLLTASPPCQAASCAGLRLGKQDPRWLWDQAIKALEITKPRWAIFENVVGLLTIDGGLAYESILSGMERAGYWVESFIIPASAGRCLAQKK
jgi:site-specific DNA-cytosine methylase